MSDVLHVLQMILDPKGTPVAMVLGAILIAISYLVIKAGPAVLRIMREEHEAHQKEVNQITTASREAAVQVAKEHRESIRELLDRHERNLDRLLKERPPEWMPSISKTN